MLEYLTNKCYCISIKGKDTPMKTHTSIVVEQLEVSKAHSMTAIVTYQYRRGIAGINNDGTTTWTPATAMPAWVKAEVEARLRSILLSHLTH